MGKWINCKRKEPALKSHYEALSVTDVRSRYTMVVIVKALATQVNGWTISSKHPVNAVYVCILAQNKNNNSNWNRIRICEKPYGVN